ncbi:MAG: Rnf-Nqr domain containing protein, partial [Candidatus Bipolaricaulia bacterium]
MAENIERAQAQAPATTFSVAASSATVSLIRNIVPDRVRIASYMIIIAFYVTLVDAFMIVGLYIGLVRHFSPG